MLAPGDLNHTFISFTILSVTWASNYSCLAHEMSRYFRLPSKHQALLDDEVL